MLPRKLQRQLAPNLWTLPASGVAGRRPGLGGEGGHVVVHSEGSTGGEKRRRYPPRLAPDVIIDDLLAAVLR